MVPNNHNNNFACFKETERVTDRQIERKTQRQTDIDIQWQIQRVTQKKDRVKQIREEEIESDRKKNRESNTVTDRQQQYYESGSGWIRVSWLDHPSISYLDTSSSSRPWWGRGYCTSSPPYRPAQKWINEYNMLSVINQLIIKWLINRSPPISVSLDFSSMSTFSFSL